MHIFLTGEIQVGKSTLINRWLAVHPELGTGGFRTLAGPTAEDGSDSVHIVPAADDPAFTEENRVLLRNRRLAQRVRHRFPHTFNTVGVSLLTGTRDCDVILMDEIGIQEDDAEQFQQAVLDCLDGDVPVLGVVRSLPGILTDAVRSHPKVRVVEVTPDNRSQVFDLLMEWRGAEGWS